MSEEVVNQNEQPRQKSNMANIIFIILGALQVFIALAIIACNHWKIVKYFSNLKNDFFITITILGALLLASGICLLIDTRNHNEMLAKNYFPYSFDYDYELAVYKSIGRSRQKKIDGKRVERLSKYSDWKAYFDKKYKESIIYSNQVVKEDFCRFLNKRMRNAKIGKDMIAGILLPVELATITLFYNIIPNIAVKYISAVIIGCVVIFLCIFNQYDYDEERCFAEDVIEIVNPGFKKMLMKRESSEESHN